MRKTFFFLATMLLSIAVTAQQRTFTKSVSANYATKQVTFNISWAVGSRGVSGASTYNSKVWVLVDYQEIKNSVPSGSWQRASIDLTKLPANCTADGTNTNGFWYQGQTSAAQNANITITLTNVPAQFKWCAFASDCPPQMIINSATDIKLRGTTSFIIKYTDNTTDIVNSKTYSLRIGKTFASISDMTNAPGNVQCLTRDKASVNGYCCGGQTIVNGYCRDLEADNAIKSTVCGYEMEISRDNVAATITSSSFQSNCPTGWRIASANEYRCFILNKSAIPNFNPLDWYTTGVILGWGGSGESSVCRSCTAVQAVSGITPEVWQRDPANLCNVSWDGIIWIWQVCLSQPPSGATRCVR